VFHPSSPLFFSSVGFLFFVSCFKLFFPSTPLISPAVPFRGQGSYFFPSFRFEQEFSPVSVLPLRMHFDRCFCSSSPSISLPPPPFSSHYFFPCWKGLRAGSTFPASPLAPPFSWRSLVRFQLYRPLSFLVLGPFLQAAGRVAPFLCSAFSSRPKAPVPFLLFFHLSFVVFFPEYTLSTGGLFLDGRD